MTALSELHLYCFALLESLIGLNTNKGKSSLHDKQVSIQKVMHCIYRRMVDMYSASVREGVCPTRLIGMAFT